MRKLKWMFFSHGSNKPIMLSAVGPAKAVWVNPPLIFLIVRWSSLEGFSEAGVGCLRDVYRRNLQLLRAVSPIHVHISFLPFLVLPLETLVQRRRKPGQPDFSLIFPYLSIGEATPLIVPPAGPLIARLLKRMIKARHETKAPGEGATLWTSGFSVTPCRTALGRSSRTWPRLRGACRLAPLQPYNCPWFCIYSESLNHEPFPYQC